MDADADTDLCPLALQYLLDQLARTVASGGRQLEGQGLTVAILAAAVRLQTPASVFKKLLSLDRIVEVVRHIVGETLVKRLDKAVGDSLAVGEQRFDDRGAVEA